MNDTGVNVRTASHPPGAIAPSWFDQAQAAEHDNAATATQAATDASTPAGGGGGGDLPADLIGRTSIALIAVIAVILICAWALKRLGFQRDRASRSLPIVASRSLGQRERVVIVEVEDEWLVLGVTPQNITALHRRPAPDDRAPVDTIGGPGVGKRPTFGQALNQALTANIARLTGRTPR
ncbi:flagellar biosynthetic protein FliO [Salinisphaera sp.]|uniref:flagellar biosynthetic protein FliO n=1 Tax=Salinisphaera sp. TaxID=1914330 RepID=UPI002D79A2FD|nr:flagellar biosynthetic protein FliO [Salinisphaera sp.]HET7312727.1 flagellar biosynthetic protein FliO [Salinisphaera sp.]